MGPTRRIDQLKEIEHAYRDWPCISYAMSRAEALQLIANLADQIANKPGSGINEFVCYDEQDGKKLVSLVVSLTS